MIFISCKNEERELETDPGTIEMEEELVDERMSFGDSILDAIEQDPELGTFAAALNSWNVEDTLNEIEEEFIIFAPSNIAYSQIYQDHGQDLLEANADDVVAYHLVKTSEIDNIRQELMTKGDSLSLETLQGEEITLALEEGNMVLYGGKGNKATVTDSIQGPNGMVYIIDGVLLPGTIETKVVITAEE